ncbi:hypothetical protein [Alloscardovia sp. HMSC034E08]|uniref:hypothetical protein n=1 Tax=Alloscardovia sp. HMSC034E08 TaxID=1739413 RepID=UPI0008D03FEC|nr:hypothetical protein [Alloscardovia sp. HMSC034E08]OFQ97528.1 hypothetical protein HMPREF2909_02875 [Alloscardovia sp. HMSC034E08]
MVIVAVLSERTRIPFVLVANVAIGTTCGYIMTNPETTWFNADIYIQSAIALLGCVLVCVAQGVTHTPARRAGVHIAVALVSLCCVWTCVWQGGIAVNHSQQLATPTIWSVSSTFEQTSKQSGTIKKISYSTRAYATDKRAVTKSAYVYLPYKYDASKSYNILYLMHGIGDNEAYWFVTHPENKVLVD